MIKSGKVNGILGIVKGSAPELIYPKTEIANYEVSSFTLRSNQWKYQGVESLKNLRLGIVQGYSYGETNPKLEKFLKDPLNKPNIFEATSLSRAFFMVERKRIDVMLEDTRVAEYVLNKEKLQKKIKNAGLVSTHEHLGFLGFNQQNSKSQKYADIFDAGMTKLRNSNKLKSILDRYNVKDWK